MFFKILKNKEQSKNVNFILKPNINAFEINKIYISGFFKFLWNNPEAVYNILKNSNNDIIENNLANFFVNNFFNNFLSENSLENNLLYIITMMLKDEIDNMKDISLVDAFLENSKVSFLLKEMINFPEIQSYFKKIIFQMIEKMEDNYSWKKVNFNMSQTYSELKNFVLEENSKASKKNKKSIEEICKNFINMKLNENKMNTIEENEYLNEKNIKQGIDLEASF